MRFVVVRVIPWHEIYLFVLLKLFRTSDSKTKDLSNEDSTSNDRISRSPQVVDSSPSHSNLIWYVVTSTGDYLYRIRKKF